MKIWDGNHVDFMGRKQQIPALIHTRDSTTPDTGTPNPPDFSPNP